MNFFRTGERERTRTLMAATAAAVLLIQAACACKEKALKSTEKPRQSLEIMSISGQESTEFERRFLSSFRQREGVETEHVPALETVNNRLLLYQQLLRAHSPKPDLLHIDIIWPAILSEHLVELGPYVGDQVKNFPEELIDSYTVKGKLLALPIVLDVGVLYYRPELLNKYGYSHPPDTWEELEQMSSRIQRGERQAGKKSFWGYTFQGGAYEGLTCNALEWQASVGAGVFVERSERVHVCDNRFAAMLRRAAGWVGTISPPGEYAYDEFDSVNLWNSGRVAFMRNWTSLQGVMQKRPGTDSVHFAVAPLPGRYGTLGGRGLAVSAYSANRELALRALYELTGEKHDAELALAQNGTPIHLSVARRANLQTSTLVPDIADKLAGGLVARPSLVTGAKYSQVSGEYCKAINQILKRKADPEAALAQLEKKLVEITGFPAQRD